MSQYAGQDKPCLKASLVFYFMCESSSVRKLQCGFHQESSSIVGVQCAFGELCIERMNSQGICEESQRHAQKAWVQHCPGVTVLHIMGCSHTDPVVPEGFAQV